MRLNESVHARRLRAGRGGVELSACASARARARLPRQRGHPARHLSGRRRGGPGLRSGGRRNAQPELGPGGAVERPLNEHAIYTVGSRLVSHLLRRFGAPAFVQLYARLGHYATPSEVDQAMMAVYGSSAEQLWQDALAAPPGCIPIWACAGDAGAIDGSPLPAGESCGADEDYRTFTSPDAGGVLVSFSARSRLRAGSCDDPGFEPPWLAHGEFINSAAGHIAAADIAPGKHYLAFTGSASSIRVQRPPAPFTGPECRDVAATHPRWRRRIPVDPCRDSAGSTRLAGQAAASRSTAPRDLPAAGHAAHGVPRLRLRRARMYRHGSLAAVRPGGVERRLRSPLREAGRHHFAGPGRHRRPLSQTARLYSGQAISWQTPRTQKMPGETGHSAPDTHGSPTR